MKNPVVIDLESGKKTSPYLIDQERYQRAIDEINRLQSIVDSHAAHVDGTHERIRVYEGLVWNADESSDSVRIFRGNLQIIKAPKHHPELEPYWPGSSMIEWIIAALNHAESAGQDPSR
jgi:hypothetical protein